MISFRLKRNMILCLLIVLILISRYPITVTPHDAEDSLHSDRAYGNIRHVSLIFRHGDRTPLGTIPSDPYKDYSWPNGFGQLTDVGKRRLVRVGRWFRAYYGNLTAETYWRKQVIIQASRIDRTIMSAQCFLYGYYPTNKSNSWMENELWQPIPVHSISKEVDNLITTGRNCKLRSQMSESDFKDADSDNVRKQYEHVIEYIGEKLNVSFSSKSNNYIFNLLQKIEDNFQVYKENNLTLPEWAAEIFPMPLGIISSRTVRRNYLPLKITRLVTGPLLQSIVSDMKRKIEDESFEQTLHVYSGHDSTIQRILTALRVFNGTRNPPYGTCVILELQHNGTAHIVSVLYKEEKIGSAYRLDMPGCGTSCTYEQFYDMVQPMIPEDWEAECNLKSNQSPTMLPNISFITGTVLLYFVCK